MMIWWDFGLFTMRYSTELCFALVTTLFGQTPPYTISTLAGTNPTGDNGRARDARLLPGALDYPPPSPVAATLAIRAGNHQTGNTGQLLPQALTAAALSTTNAPAPAQAIAFSVTTGTATLSAASVNTGTDGLASITVTLGATAGPVQITARSGTLTPVVFSLTATERPSATPLRPTISPRGTITIFGQNFLKGGVTGRRVDFATESVNGLLPTRLLGACVEIGGVRAPMRDAFDTQLNVVVPAVPGPTAAVRVIRRCDQADSFASEPETVPVATAPEFLYSQSNRDGPSAARIHHAPGAASFVELPTGPSGSAPR